MANTESAPALRAITRRRCVQHSVPSARRYAAESDCWLSAAIGTFDESVLERGPFRTTCDNRMRTHSQCVHAIRQRSRRAALQRVTSTSSSAKRFQRRNDWQSTMYVRTKSCLSFGWKLKRSVQWLFCQVDLRCTDCYYRSASSFCCLSSGRNCAVMLEFSWKLFRSQFFSPKLALQNWLQRKLIFV